MASRLGTHLALAHLEVGLKIGGAFGIHALLICLAAERLTLDARCPALGAHAGLALQRAHLDARRDRIGHIAIRPAHAANKAATRLGARLHDQILAALGALAYLCVGGHSVGDGLPQVIFMLNQRIEHACEQSARMVNHVLLRVLALCHARHIRIQLGSHLGRGNTRSKLVQGVDDSHAQLAWLDGVVFKIANGIETLDDARARRLGAQAALFHLLYELALAIARGRLGLLRLKLDVVYIDNVALRQRRKLLITLEAIRIRLTKTRIYQHVTGRRERLARNVDRKLGVLDGCRAHKRSQETACDKVIELLLAAIEGLGVALAGGMNRRMVGGLGLAARGLHGTGKDLFAYGSKRRRTRRQPFDDTLKIE